MSPELERALAALAGAQRVLVALDFDGTLSRLVPQPHMARPAEGVLRWLALLAETPGTDVVLISGRARADLAQVSGAEDLAMLVGSHGQEVGADVSLEEDEAATLSDVRAAVLEEVGQIPGARVEDKPAGFAVHVRQCSPEDAEHVLTRVEQVAAEHPGTFSIEGKLVIEVSVRPLDKGSALRQLIQSDPSRRVLFAGDDVTDETALAILGPGDVGIKVGLGPTVAGHRVADPDAMVGVLEALARAREGQSRAAAP